MLKRSKLPTISRGKRFYIKTICRNCYYDISMVSLMAGSGSFAIKNSLDSGIDAFITSDLKYHNFFEADNKAILVDIGHYESENHIKLIIKEFLNKKLPNFTLLLSEENVNPVKYY